MLRGWEGWRGLAWRKGCGEGSREPRPQGNGRQGKRKGQACPCVL